MGIRACFCIPQTAEKVSKDDYVQSDPLTPVQVPSTPPHQSKSELMTAAEAGDQLRVRSLLRDGADPNKPEAGGMTALHAAAANNKRSVALELLEAKANPNVKNKDGLTPLHLAAMNGCNDIVPMLLLSGADLSATDNAGRVALDMAPDTGSQVGLRRAVLIAADQSADDIPSPKAPKARSLAPTKDTAPASDQDRPPLRRPSPNPSLADPKLAFPPKNDSEDPAPLPFSPAKPPVAPRSSSYLNSTFAAEIPIQPVPTPQQAPLAEANPQPTPPPTQPATYGSILSAAAVLVTPRSRPQSIPPMSETSEAISTAAIAPPPAATRQATVEVTQALAAVDVTAAGANGSSPPAPPKRDSVRGATAFMSPLGKVGAAMQAAASPRVLPSPRVDPEVLEAKLQTKAAQEQLQGVELTNEEKKQVSKELAVWLQRREVRMSIGSEEEGLIDAIRKVRLRSIQVEKEQRQAPTEFSRSASQRRQAVSFLANTIPELIPQSSGEMTPRSDAPLSPTASAPRAAATPADTTMATAKPAAPATPPAAELLSPPATTPVAKLFPAASDPAATEAAEPLPPAPQLDLQPEQPAGEAAEEDHLSSMLSDTLEPIAEGQADDETWLTSNDPEASNPLSAVSPGVGPLSPTSRRISASDVDNIHEGLTIVTSPERTPNPRRAALQGAVSSPYPPTPATTPKTPSTPEVAPPSSTTPTPKTLTSKSAKKAPSTLSFTTTAKKTPTRAPPLQIPTFDTSTSLSRSPGLTPTRSPGSAPTRTPKTPASATTPGRSPLGRSATTPITPHRISSRLEELATPRSRKVTPSVSGVTPRASSFATPRSATSPGLATTPRRTHSFTARSNRGGSVTSIASSTTLEDRPTWRY